MNSGPASGKSLRSLRPTKKYGRLSGGRTVGWHFDVPLLTTLPGRLRLFAGLLFLLWLPGLALRVLTIFLWHVVILV